MYGKVIGYSKLSFSFGKYNIMAVGGWEMGERRLGVGGYALGVCIFTVVLLNHFEF